MQMDDKHADLRPVLVVEDCDDDFDTVVVAAAQARVANRLVRATDADTAWQLLASASAGPFAFMRLDFNLSGFDGLALLYQVRRNKLLAQLPVVVLTTSINPRDRDAFCAAGASAFHVKPVQYTDGLHTLVAIFDRCLRGIALPSHKMLPLAGPSVGPSIGQST